MKSVLVVDDSRVVQESTKYLFEQMGCSVVIAQDGKSAIKAVETFFDLVLLDIHLPDIDGASIAKTIKVMENQNNQSKKTLIVAHTANEKYIHNDCLVNYFDDYIVKPILEKDINRLIQCLLNK